MTESDAVLNRDLGSPSQPWPVAGPGAYRILFVSDDAGERASIAASLAGRMGGDWSRADCAGFDRQAPNPWVSPELARLLQEQGGFVSAAYPRLVSTLVGIRPRPSYACVVVITGASGPEVLPLFRRYVHALAGTAESVQHWRIAEFGFGVCKGAGLERQIAEVIGQLRTEVAWLLADRSDATRVA